MWQADGDANCRLCDESATSVNPVQDKSINRIEAHRANTRTNTAAGAVSRRGEAVGSSGGAGVDSDAAFGSNFKKKFDMHAEESPFLECLSRCEPTSYPTVERALPMPSSIRSMIVTLAFVASTAAIPSTLLRDSKHAHTVGKMMSQSEPCTSSYKEDTSSKECDWGGYWCGRRVNGYTGCDRCSCQGCDPKICPPGEDPGVPYDGGIGGGRDLCATDHTQC